MVRLGRLSRGRRTALYASFAAGLFILLVAPVRATHGTQTLTQIAGPTIETLWDAAYDQDGGDRLRSSVLSPDGLPTPDFRRNVIVELYDKGGVKVKEGEVFEAWPAVLEIGDLDAESSDVLIETLELANEGHRQTL